MRPSRLFFAMVCKMNEVEKVDTKIDAKDRAWRTLVTGLCIDVAVAVVIVLAMAFANIEWTPAYWIALGSAVGKTILQTGAAYLMRMFVKPYLERIK